MVFGNLMRLKNHHVAKIDSTGRQIYYERLIGQIVEGITDFPAHLSLDDQGRFAIGYYHQRQDFYTKKDEKPEIREESK
jgi:CRISPR-associated protein Csd1